MKKHVAKKWVKALRSGEYSQGRKRLVDNDDNFCCMGVLCNIAPPSTGEWIKGSDGYWSFGSEESRSGSTLPNNVMQWAGLSSCNPYLKHEGFGDSSLIDFNDSEKLNFNQIADIIEENYLK